MRPFLKGSSRTSSMLYFFSFLKTRCISLIVAKLSSLMVTTGDSQNPATARPGSCLLLTSDCHFPIISVLVASKLFVLHKIDKFRFLFTQFVFTECATLHAFISKKFDGKNTKMIIASW